MAILSRMNPKLTADHTGLVLFDAMKGYLFPTDPAEKAAAEKSGILRKLQALLTGGRQAGMTTFYPMGHHASDGSDTVARLTDTDNFLRPLAPGSQSIIPRYFKDTKAAEIADELAPLPTDVLVPKHRWNAFHLTDLEFHLKVRALDTIVIAGGATDVGVASTVFGARDLDLGIVVVRDACFSKFHDNHDFLMERIFPRMARVMTVDQAVALMR